MPDHHGCTTCKHAAFTSCGVLCTHRDPKGIRPGPLKGCDSWEKWNGRPQSPAEAAPVQPCAGRNEDCADRKLSAPAPLPAELRERLGREAWKARIAAALKRQVSLYQWEDARESEREECRCEGERIYRLAMRDHNDWTSEEAREQFDGAIRQRDAAIARAEQAERERDAETRRARAWQSAHDVECERRRQAEQERDELRTKLATAAEHYAMARGFVNSLLITHGDDRFERAMQSAREWIARSPAPKSDL